MYCGISLSCDSIEKLKMEILKTILNYLDHVQWKKRERIRKELREVLCGERDI
jgi:hypothetical protein